MADLKPSTRKLNALQYACLGRHCILHFDSVFLAKGRSFASAFSISVIASEEFGKAFALAEIVDSASTKGNLASRTQRNRESVALAQDSKQDQVRDRKKPKFEC